MDPITQGIVAGLLANGLTALIAEGARGRTASEPSAPDRLQPLLTAPAAALGRRVAATGTSQAHRLARFLASDEVEHLMRGLFSTAIAEDADRSRAAIRREFRLFHAAALEGTEAADQADDLFDALVEACNASLDAAVDQGILAGLEGKAALRHRQLQDRLDAIEQNIAFLNRDRPPDPETIERFITDYRRQAASWYGYLTPQSIDGQRKLPIDDLFVPPRLTPNAASPHPQPRLAAEANTEPVPMTTAIKAIARTVVLGNPGGGKTTLAHKLVHLLTTCPDDPHIAGRRLTPLFVTLRDYAEAKRRDDLSVIQFIAARCNAELQLPVEPEVIEYLLRTGRALAIFDGLDELLDTRRRREISNTIETFATRFPDAPMLVTSREVGYDQAPLDDQRFRVWRVAPFDEAQSRDYARKWFAADPDLPPTDRESTADAFLTEAAPTPDLLASPLMLSLLCTLYRGPGSLPRNRPGIYEKCADLMFDRWDRQRGIEVQLDYPSHLFYAMQHLAHWIYTTEGLTAGVTETQLITAAGDYLVDYCTDDRVEAEATAKSFVAFCRGRAWVFSDAGTRDDGERLYAFSHRTFLEYFAAAYLARNLSTRELFERLLPHIRKGQWEVVAQLAVHIKARADAGSGDEVLTAVLDEAGREELSDEERAELYGFAIRCLMFVVPRPAVRRRVVDAFLPLFLTKAAAGHERSADWSEFLDKCERNHRQLFEVARDNYDSVLSSVRSFISKALTEETEVTTAKAIAEFILLSSQPEYFFVDSHSKAQEFYARRVKDHEAKLIEVASQDLLVALLLVEAGLLSYETVFRCHGLSFLFAETRFRFQPVGLMGYLHFLLFAFRNSDYDGPFLEERYPRLAQALEKTELHNAVARSDIPKEPLDQFLADPPRGGTASLSHSIFFCTFIAGAVYYEYREEARSAETERITLVGLIADLEKHLQWSDHLSALTRLWNARTDPNRAPTDPLHFGPLQFSARQQQIIEEWVTQRLSIVRHEPHAETSR